jgi:8-oxo-dGTP pyrophosphatase MutT (NUDIX family)
MLDAWLCETGIWHQGWRLHILSWTSHIKVALEMTDFAIVHATYLVDQLVMIRKNRPGWQAGKLNLPGGHIEAGEAPFEAAHRELEEETSLTTGNLRSSGVVYAGEHVIHVFETDRVDGEPTTKTNELVEVIPYRYLNYEADQLADQNIRIIHGFVTNRIAGWALHHTPGGYKLDIPYLLP